MIRLLGDKVPNKNFPHYIKLYNECKPIDYSKIALQFCAGTIEKGVLPPTAGLATPLPPTPAGRVKSPLIRRFGLVPQWVRTLSTHAIASQAQSRCLNGNLTRLDRNSLRSFRKLLEKGLCPFRRLASPISPIPVGRETRRLRGISPALSRGCSPLELPRMGV